MLKSLCCAAYNGTAWVLKTLHSWNIVYRKTFDIHGQIPLCGTAEHGSEGVVKIQHGQDSVDPDREANYGQRQLPVAAENSRGEVK